MYIEVQAIQEYFEHKVEDLKESNSRDYIDGYSCGIYEAFKIFKRVSQDNCITDKDCLKRVLVDAFDDEHTIALMRNNSSCLGGLELEMANGTFDAHKDVLEYITKV
jgi:hypothetical protein